MKKLFYYLLKKYSRTEEDRLIILSKLQEQVNNEYNEQTIPGNVHNFFIEFMLSNEYVINKMKQNDIINLQKLRSGINSAFAESLEWLKNDIKWKK